MNLPRRSNPITEMQVRAQQVMPDGIRYRKYKGQRVKDTPNLRRPIAEYVGLRLVTWLIQQGRREEALDLLGNIKNGKVHPVTGEKTADLKRQVLMDKIAMLKKLLI